MNRTRSRELLLGLASVVFFMLLLAAGWLWHVRLDLTRNQAFSIAEATRAAIRRLAPGAWRAEPASAKRAGRYRVAASRWTPACPAWFAPSREES
jgi:hypothetical protein